MARCNPPEKRNLKIPDRPLIIASPNQTARTVINSKGEGGGGVYTCNAHTHTSSFLRGKFRKKEKKISNSGKKGTGGVGVVKRVAGPSRWKKQQKSWEPSPCLFHQCQIAKPRRSRPFFFSFFPFFLRQHGPRVNKRPRLNETPPLLLLLPTTT